MPRREQSARLFQNKVASSTVVKALTVLNALADICETQSKGASVTEISQQSGEIPSSVCKHLAAFQQTGLVEQDHVTERYRIGMYALRLATLAMKEMSIREIAASYLHKVADQVGETVHLVVRDGLRVVYIDKVESPKTIRMHSRIGLRNPMYCTGVGKAILAYSPSSLIEAVVAEGMTSYTPKTLTTRRSLLEDLDRIRERGFAIDDVEHEPEVRCVAAPILNHRNEPLGSISISCPVWRLPDEQVVEYGKLIKEVAEEISRRFGHIPALPIE